MKAPKLIFVALCCTGICLVLFIFDHYHATRCTHVLSSEDVNARVADAKNRLLEIKTQSVLNTIMMRELLLLLENRLKIAEEDEIDSLSKKGEDEAVRVALVQASLADVPIIPHSKLDRKRLDTPGLLDALVESMTLSSPGKSGPDELDGQAKFGEYNFDTLSDSEVEKKCADWRDRFNVQIGISWGSLPPTAQQGWLSNDCDSRLKK
jgi:hypothetical protein